MDATIFWRIRGYIILATFGTLIFFGGLGYGLDRYWGTSPKLLIGLILLSFPVSNFLAIRLTKNRLSPPTHL
jgi:F0F1-type ATP synthase assembly protein I